MTTTKTQIPINSSKATSINTTSPATSPPVKIMISTITGATASKKKLQLEKIGFKTNKETPTMIEIIIVQVEIKMDLFWCIFKEKHP